MRWWEVVAAGASTPALGALAALATKRGSTESDFAAVEKVYFPWVNALNTLLDSLVDLDEDPALQRHIERYGSMQAAAERVAAIATRARAGVSELGDGQRHELILAAMGGYYLAEPAAWLGERSEIAGAVLASLGPFAGPTLRVHKLRRARREPPCAPAAVGWAPRPSPAEPSQGSADVAGARDRGGHGRRGVEEVAGAGEGQKAAGETRRHRAGGAQVAVDGAAVDEVAAQR